MAKRWGRDDPLTALRSFWDLMFDEFTLAFIHYDALNPRDPLAWALDHRCLDCRLGSALLAALCRASRIPARLVSGYTLNPVLPTAHTWCEIWTAPLGWRPFDLYSLDLAGGDRTSPWRWHFFGRIDHRFVAERPPRLFCGTGAIRLPQAWHMVSQTIDGGSMTSFEQRDTGQLVYSEAIRVTRATPPSA
jgi:transglutaminase-like putative cysteine protease